MAKQRPILGYATDPKRLSIRPIYPSLACCNIAAPPQPSKCLAYRWLVSIVLTCALTAIATAQQQRPPTVRLASCIEPIAQYSEPSVDDAGDASPPTQEKPKQAKAKPPQPYK